MLFLDPPDHSRLRALVNQTFTPRTVNALEARIRRLLGSLLDDIGACPTGRLAVRAARHWMLTEVDIEQRSAQGS